MKTKKPLFVNYFKLLRVNIFSSDEEIKAKYHEIAHKCHPDKVKGKETKFMLATEGKEILLDYKKKSLYLFENIEEFNFPYTTISINYEKNQKTNLFVYFLEPRLTGIGSNTQPLIYKHYYQIKIPKYNFFIIFYKNENNLKLINKMISSIYDS